MNGIKWNPNRRPRISARKEGLSFDEFVDQAISAVSPWEGPRIRQGRGLRRGIGMTHMICFVSMEK